MHGPFALLCVPLASYWAFMGPEDDVGDTPQVLKRQAALIGIPAPPLRRQ
jgi:hypothetical protein